MSRLSTIATILPGEQIATIAPGGADGSVSRLNKMFGSASQLTALANAAGLDASNFRQDASIRKSQKNSPYAQYVLPFGFAGSQAAVSSNTTLDLLLWEPRPATWVAFTDGGSSDLRINYTTSAASTSTANLTVSKQIQYGSLIQFASVALTLDGAFHSSSANIVVPANENKRIMPEKQERIIVQLVFTSGGGTPSCTFTRFDGALVLTHSHVRWND